MLLTPEERRKGIGGSDVGAIMGANPYCSIVKLYKEKKGEVDPPSLNHAMEWGNLLEDVIAKKYAKDNNFYFDPDAVPLNHDSDYVPCPDANDGVIYKPSIIRSPKDKWAYAHPDFFVQIGEPDRYELSGIEVKTVSEGMYRKYWANNEIPPWQYYQVVWYSIVTGIDHWKLVGLAPHLRLSTDPILVHDLYIDSDTKTKVLSKVGYFWSCLESGVIPHIEKPSEADLKLLYPTNTMDMVQSSGTIDAAVRRLYDVRMQKAPLEDEEDTLKNLIKSHMGNAGKLISQEGEELASFKSPTPKVKIDYKSIVESLHKCFDDMPSDATDWARSQLDKCIADNTKAFTQSRRFLLKAKYE
ncbi:YqaJ viral recombinase family protein [Planktomarina temperata]|nr:YqaJ viral recombinase family protein [Planktomarina temperata]